MDPYAVSGRVCLYREFTAGRPNVALALLSSDSGVHDGMAYIVQEILPAPGLYEPVAGELMEEGMQRALLEFHQELAERRIGFSDGHKDNLYFFREAEDGPLICGILDQDRVWEFGKGLRSGTFTPKAVELTEVLFEVPHMEMFRIRSLRGCEFTPEVLALLKRGYCPWPDAEFLMMKMLEHRGWILYDGETGKFVGKRMDIEIVEDVFKRLNHPDSIDTKFDVPEHLRHLVPDPPPSNLPGGGQSFNTLPFPNIMPWVTALRVAA